MDVSPSADCPFFRRPPQQDENCPRFAHPPSQVVVPLNKGIVSAEEADWLFGSGRHCDGGLWFST